MFGHPLRQALNAGENSGMISANAEIPDRLLEYNLPMVLENNFGIDRHM
jgi:hypothetical protein